MIAIPSGCQPGEESLGGGHVAQLQDRFGLAEAHFRGVRVFREFLQQRVIGLARCGKVAKLFLRDSQRIEDVCTSLGCW